MANLIRQRKAHLSGLGGFPHERLHQERDWHPWQFAILIYQQISNQYTDHLTRISGRLRSAPLMNLCVATAIKIIDCDPHGFGRTDQYMFDLLPSWLPLAR
ncbi:MULTISPECIES: hypothetical protein [Moorena]|uniref:hypothetical protein n=1 Tax=Moorena TaxID=1155738 RepID=UPI0012B59266|nr:MULTISPECIES: hypothetical protein [Moorena]